MVTVVLLLVVEVVLALPLDALTLIGASCKLNCFSMFLAASNDDDDDDDDSLLTLSLVLLIFDCSIVVALRPK